MTKANPQTDPTLEANKQLVLDFFRCVMEAQDADAAKNFVTEDYIQHASHVESGRAGLEKFVRTIFPDGPRPVQPTLNHAPTFIVADGDMVIVSAYFPQPEPDAPQRFYDYYVFDAFRIENGKLAEHWGSINKIAPPKHPSPDR